MKARLFLSALLLSSTINAAPLPFIGGVMNAVPDDLSRFYTLGAAVYMAQSDSERAAAFSRFLSHARSLANKHQHLIEQIPTQLDSFLSSPLGKALRQWVESSDAVQKEVEEVLKREVLGIDSNYIPLR